jgi:two-component system, chemotaxis family, chemotaxis protein CheY
MKILVADDTNTLRQLLRGVLLEAGHAVVEAEDGAVALVRFIAERPDFVITDLHMPVMDGVDLTRAIRKLPQGRNVPIFILSMESAPARKAEGRDAGATGWMVKPFDPRRLLSMIDRYAAG